MPGCTAAHLAGAAAGPHFHCPLSTRASRSLRLGECDEHRRRRRLHVTCVSVLPPLAATRPQRPALALSRVDCKGGGATSLGGCSSIIPIHKGAKPPQLPPFGKSAFASAPRCACSAAPVSTCRPRSRVPRLGTRLGGLRFGGVAVSASPLSSWRCSGAPPDSEENDPGGLGDDLVH